MGRRTLLNPELQAEIIKRLATGADITFVAKSVGITDHTIHEWRQRGERWLNPNEPNLPEDEKYAQFAQETARARDEGRMRLVAEIAADKDWRAKSWLLKVYDPDRFSEKHITELQGKGGGPIQLAAQRTDPDHESKLYNAMVELGVLEPGAVPELEAGEPESYVEQQNDADPVDE